MILEENKRFYIREIDINDEDEMSTDINKSWVKIAVKYDLDLYDLLAINVAYEYFKFEIRHKNTWY